MLSISYKITGFMKLENIIKVLEVIGQQSTNALHQTTINDVDIEADTTIFELFNSFKKENNIKKQD